MICETLRYSLFIIKLMFKLCIFPLEAMFFFQSLSHFLNFLSSSLLSHYILPSWSHVSVSGDTNSMFQCIFAKNMLFVILIILCHNGAIYTAYILKNPRGIAPFTFAIVYADGRSCGQPPVPVTATTREPTGGQWEALKLKRKETSWT